MFSFGIIFFISQSRRESAFSASGMTTSEFHHHLRPGVPAMDAAMGGSPRPVTGVDGSGQRIEAGRQMREQEQKRQKGLQHAKREAARLRGLAEAERRILGATSTRKKNEKYFRKAFPPEGRGRGGRRITAAGAGSARTRDKAEL